MQIKHFAIAASASLCVALGASAEVPSNDKAPKLIASAGSFAALDRNGDDRISRSEAGYDPLLSQTFAELDTDGDGYVSTAEYAAAEKTRNPVSSNVSGQ